MENQKPQPFNNLTKGKITALRELAERDDVVIRKAHKGGAVVIIGMKDYIREAKSQLKNRNI